LEKYSMAEPSERQSMIEQMGRSHDLPTATVLQRILTEATDEDHRWAASRSLRFHRSAAVQRSTRELDTAGRNVPLLVTVGLAWMGRETQRANALLRRAVDVAAERGAPAEPELLAVLASLIDTARMAGQYGEAAALLRTRLLFNEPAAGADLPPAVELLALHAAQGPLPHFLADLRALDRTHLTTPQAAYSLAMLLRRAGHPALAEAVAAAAMATGDASAARRIAAGQFLSERRFDAWAQRELSAALVAEMPAAVDNAGPEQGIASRIQIADAALRLALIAADQKRHAVAVDYIEQAQDGLREYGHMVKTDRTGRQQYVGLEQLRVDAAYQGLLAARKAGDQQAVRQRLDDLLMLPLTDIDIVSEILPILREHKRDAAADDLFERLYAEYKTVLEQDPEHPEYLNNVAWFGARSGERPAEAVALATKAIELDRDNAAYLDTAAEAHFRNGNAAEAVRLETRALQLRPNDYFMREQLKRFRGALVE
jgi:tetratricopeptide (TPR) repeat protein